jgi:anti-anti-sigma factor
VARAGSVSEEPTSEPYFQILPLGDGNGFRLIGELDLSTVGVLCDALESAGVARLDLADLSFIDASGLHVIEQHARALNGTAPLVLEHVPANVQRLLELTGMGDNPRIRVQSNG